MELQKIKFLEDATDFTDAEGGYSAAIKKFFTKKDKKYFLKIGNFSINKDLEKLFSFAEIPHPKIIEIGSYDEKNGYIIEEAAEGTSFKYTFDQFAPKFIYEFGFKIGQKFRNLRKIYPDKKIDKKTFDNYMNLVDDNLKDLSLNSEIYKDKLTQNQLDFFDFIKQYLDSNRKLVKGGIVVFAHPDVKPGNFLLCHNGLLVIDFEGTGYHELSTAIRWSYARSDFNDEKNFAFARGYLEGLLNFCIPKGFLKCCNYTYINNICRTIIKSLQNENFAEIDKLINYIKSNYIENGKVCVDKHLVQFGLFKQIPLLKDFDITLVSGSYNPENLTFKCTKDDKKYFLKLSKNNKKNYLKQSLNCYFVMEKADIPISPVCSCGKFRGSNIVYFLYDFLDMKELHFSANTPSFEKGVKFGNIVAQQLQKLKTCKSKNFKKLDKNDLLKTLTNNIESIFKDSEDIPLTPFKKSQLLGFLNDLAANFDDEPINLIHSDVKFDNILCDGKNIAFVDNEELKYSYDVINFYYNFFICFKSSLSQLSQGFINGYLKYMNGGKIPQRINGQMKFLLLASLIEHILNVVNKVGSDKNIPLLNDLCEQYIVKNEEIKWLK